MMMVCRGEKLDVNALLGENTHTHTHTHKVFSIVWIGLIAGVVAAIRRLGICMSERESQHTHREVGGNTVALWEVSGKKNVLENA
jgi:hypothetical protein